MRESHLQVVKRNVTVASRWCWGCGWWRCVIGEVSMVVWCYLGNLIEVVLGSGWWRCAIGGGAREEVQSALEG